MARIRQHLDKVVAPREEHVGGPHPFKKIKSATFCHLHKCWW